MDAAGTPGKQQAAAAAARRRYGRNATPRPMSAEQANEIYGFEAWGAGYFRVGDDGRLRVHPTREDDVWVDLHEAVDGLRRRKSPPPLVLRFPQMIESQVRALHGAFGHAIDEFDYGGRYRGVFPIKVNQLQAFVSELVQAGTPWGHGLEAGTKPELALALASGLPAGSLVICNGYKDAHYVELALAGARLGYTVVLILEKLHELHLVLKVARRMGVEPILGLRLKVAARGTGKWAKSGGHASKFGLTTSEILEAVRVLEAEKLDHCLRLLHFHIGSQITSVRRIRQGVQEGAQFYARLRAKGLELDYIDVGGGLGVDYDGSRTASDSSVNYTLQEYANDVVYTLQEVCEQAGVTVPNIVSESGRATSAYHSLVVFAVERQQTIPLEVPVPELPEDADQTVRGLVETRSYIGPKNYVECYHDTLQYMEQVQMLFNLGRLSLEERALAEATAEQILHDVVYFAKVSGRRIPEEIEELQRDIAKRYVCNFSVFQSIPDFWALGQLFPIAPIHRLDEYPTTWATIVDITCDSDGKIDTFAGVREDEDALRVHELRKEPYYLGAFLTGAYQDVMGDFHNLLAETREARVEVTGAGVADVRPTRVPLQLSGEVLELFGYRRRDLRARFRGLVDRARAEHGMDDDEARRHLRSLDRVLSTSPYLA